MSYDFFRVTMKTRGKCTTVYPEFIVNASDNNLMIKGKQFYAIYLEDEERWSTNITDVARIIDEALYIYRDKIESDNVNISLLSEFSSGQWKKFLDYVKSLPDNYRDLDRKIIFADTKVKKEDYSTKRVPYNLSNSATPYYDKLVSVLYLPAEQQKFEWMIGAIFTGASRHIQKFLVFYGSPKTGKSTIINIFQMLFEGYYGIFDAKSIGQSSSSFAMESLSANPLVAIQHDGDLSGIEDNTRLNSIIAHESLNVNEKFKSIYSMQFDSCLIMGTNKPVRISDSKSGIVRRLIDIYPTGDRLSGKEYDECMTNIKYELGGIAQKCIKVFTALGERYYDEYIPINMIYNTNDMYTFVSDNYELFFDKNYTLLSEAYKLYTTWCDDTNAKYTMPRRIFKMELQEYFREFYEIKTVNNETYRSVYFGFKKEKFSVFKSLDDILNELPDWLKLSAHETSIFDKECKDCLAQYCSINGTPLVRWSDCKTTLNDILPTELHYVRVPENHIVIDLDLKDDAGNKSLELNLKAASKFPQTYAECSKSGNAIHLHYIYNGDVNKLEDIYKKDIEIKKFSGLSSLRRRLTLCNDCGIAEISSGLPLKEEIKVINWDGIKNERQIRTMIKKNLNKQYHADTRSSMDYIKYILDQAYENGVSYDVSDMKQAVLTFAMHSTNQAKYCVGLIDKIHWKSEEQNPYLEATGDDDVIFFDVEVFPNLFVVCYKRRGKENETMALINPTSDDIEKLCKYKLIGFNNRNYDNHILYARMMGYTNKQLYSLSQKIISDKGGKFAEAYNLSYADIYDYAAKRQSLKKWEIELKIHHLELGLEWDKDVPEELWDKVAEYCKNDVESTEAVFEKTIGDFDARCILVELANIFADKIPSVVNDSTNTLTARIIFGNDRHPSSEFIYTDLSKEFPGYKFENGVSTYKGEIINEGGYVYADPGMYWGLETLDIAGMHPSSAFQLNIFGDKYTKQYKLLYDLRIFIKHGDLEGAKKLFDGKLDEFLDDPSKRKSLSKALKLAINRVYGQTFARYPNIFRDDRNVDNIIAKRGALFMASLRHELENKGVHVIHIKTDSIKCEHMSEDIRNFIIDYGKQYGYTFETEHKFDQFCLVNDAVYIAKTAPDDPEMPEKWTATGAQFAVPYVFKTLFSKEQLEFEDYCETKSVDKGSLYLDMNEGYEDVSLYEKIFSNRKLPLEDLTKKDQALIQEYSGMSDKELEEIISRGHNYKFVGRVSSFCPIKSGCGGGVLYRYDKGKYFAAAGTKGYRWLEAENARTNPDIYEMIDTSYYEELANKAIAAISKFGNFNEFVSDLPF